MGDNLQYGVGILLGYHERFSLAMFTSMTRLQSSSNRYNIGLDLPSVTASFLDEDSRNEVEIFEVNNIIAAARRM